MSYIKQVINKNRGLVISYLLIGILNAFLLNYKADYFKKVVDGLTAGNIALGAIILYGVILIVNYCMNYVDEYPSKKLEQGIFLDFKLMALKKISRIDYLEYQTIGMGKLVQRIENGAGAGRDMLCGFWLCLFRQLIPTIFFSIYFIWKINRNITYAILAGYVIIFIVTNLLLKCLYQIKEKILDNEEKMNHFLVRGFMEMIVFRMERQFPKEIQKANQAKKEIVHAKVKMNMIHEAFFTIFALLVALLDLGILVYAWSSKAVSIGSVVALIALIDNAYTPIAIFNVLYVQYKLDKETFRRFEDFLNLKDDEQLLTGTEVQNLNGSVCIENLAFHYGEREIFEQLNLNIRAGEKVALVGESGSGKSTLVKLLAGLIKYEAGSIKIDDQELREMKLDDLYRHISYIPQDSPIFDGTLTENLVFDQAIGEKEQIEALQKVQLSALYATMEHGLQTEIGERGIILSGGERQRLALARLWFENKEITILDEATSAMDNLTEESVMNEVIQLLQKRTVIAIAHRLNSIMNFDRIVVFHQGCIVGEGTFEELMRDNPYFVSLYHASVSQEES